MTRIWNIVTTQCRTVKILKECDNTVENSDSTVEHSDCNMEQYSTWEYCETTVEHVTL